jgi:DNA invertase Pin-like site-specific DNA recombinase
MSNRFSTTEEIIKEIESGKYHDCYLIYNRKSTDEPDNQKNSIKYQKAENVRFAQKNNLHIASITIDGLCREGIISERHSAFKEDDEMIFGADNSVKYKVERPKFYRVAQWLNKKYFKGAVFLCWDRASRNKNDANIVRKLMSGGVDIRFTLAHYDKSSSGELHLDIDSMMSEHVSRVTSEKVTLTIKNSRSRGLLTNRAPVGYINNGTMDNKTFDPVRAPIIRSLFEMYATGDWTLADLARWSIQQGFTMPPMCRRRTEEEILAEEEDDIRLDLPKISRVPTFNTIQKILTNRVYTGRTLTKEGEWIPSASHEAIISDDVYEEVQKKLHEKNKSAHYAELLDHLLRRIVYCGVCGRVYTPYPKKGIMYYGARCDKNCTNSNKSINFEYITSKVSVLISNLSLTDEELEMVDARASTDIALLDLKRMKQLEVGERRKKKIREDLAYLNANRLTLLKTGAYTPEKLASEETFLNIELNSLCEEEQVSDISMTETVNEVVKLSELLKNLHFYYVNALPREKEEIIREIFSELTINEDTLKYKCKNGFKALESRFVPNCDPTGNRTQL